jgi:hypothetical protein
MSFTLDTLPDGDWGLFTVRSTVKALRLETPFEFTDATGQTHMCRDGWLVRDATGTVYPVPDTLFEAIYQRV